MQRLQHLSCSASNQLVCICRPEQMFLMTSKGASVTSLSMLPSPTNTSWLGMTTSPKQWTTRLHRRLRTKCRRSDNATSSCSRYRPALKCLVILHVCTASPSHSSARFWGWKICLGVCRQVQLFTALKGQHCLQNTDGFVVCWASRLHRAMWHNH